MVIRINEKNEVTAIYRGEMAKAMTADNERYFDVDNIPEVEGNKVLCFDPETREFSTKERVIDEAKAEEYRNRMEAQQKKANALKWLADNDWKVNKHVLGEWTDRDSRWLEYLAGREKARRDIDQVEYIINQ